MKLSGNVYLFPQLPHTKNHLLDGVRAIHANVNYAVDCINAEIGFFLSLCAETLPFIADSSDCYAWCD